MNLFPDAVLEKSRSQFWGEFKIFSLMGPPPQNQNPHCEKCFVFNFKTINYLHHWSGFLPKQSSIWNSIIQYEVIWENRSRKKHKYLFILNNTHKYLQLLSPLVQIMITIECSYTSGSWDLPVEFALLTWNFSTQTTTLVWR